MKHYKVSFWFSSFDDGRTGNPDKVVYVETDKTERRDITRLALDKLDKYPRSYQVLVEPAGDVDTLYVVQISDSDEADENAWYHMRDGEMFVVRKKGSKFATCHFLGNTSTIGYIHPQYCTVVHTFKAENAF